MPHISTYHQTSKIKITQPLLALPNFQFKASNPESIYLEKAMEERIKAIEGDTPFGRVNPTNFCLVKGVVIPPKYKLS